MIRRQSARMSVIGGGRKVTALCVAVFGLVACHPSSPGATTETAAAHASAAQAPGEAPGGSEAKANGTGTPAAGRRPNEPPTIVLKPEQMQSIGLATGSVTTAEHRDEVAGYGVVLVHDAIAQAVAELRAAQAVAHQSQSALARARSLAGSPGAVSFDIEEAAVRQAAVDAAALALAEQRLATVIGASPPWPAAQRLAMLEKLAAGKIKLVRATFPLGALNDERPSTMRATALGAPSGRDSGWILQPVWSAPADASVPGRSFFALLARSDAAAEGERLMVNAPAGMPRRGVEIPSSAVVMSAGKYWCYVERAPGTFARIEIATDAATPSGYFVTAGVHAGDRLVTAAAGQLLAQESNSGAAAD